MCGAGGDLFRHDLFPFIISSHRPDRESISLPRLIHISICFFTKSFVLFDNLIDGETHPKQDHLQNKNDMEKSDSFEIL